MSDFIIYPAIDLRYGKVVRLRQGKADQQTTYSNDPYLIARQWINQGARWLHVVNLNGAFGEDTRENELAIEEILTAYGDEVDVQLGGGIRTIAATKSAFSMGISRVVLGTAVIEKPDFGVEVLNQFGGSKLAFGFDSINQRLMTHGWKNRSEISMEELAKKLADAGAKYVIYTNISKDGMGTGVDWQRAMLIAEQTGMSVIASGGTSTLADIPKVKAAGLDGVIIGRALYEGVFTLREAIDVN